MWPCMGSQPVSLEDGLIIRRRRPSRCQYNHSIWMENYATFVWSTHHDSRDRLLDRLLECEHMRWTVRSRLFYVWAHIMIRKTNWLSMNFCHVDCWNVRTSSIRKTSMNFCHVDYLSVSKSWPINRHSLRSVCRFVECEHITTNKVDCQCHYAMERSLIKIYPLTARVVGAPPMISQPVSSNCPLWLGELQACPFPDVVFPPLPLSASSSSPFHCALQDGFGQTW